MGLGQNRLHSLHLKLWISVLVSATLSQFLLYVSYLLCNCMRPNCNMSTHITDKSIKYMLRNIVAYTWGAEDGIAALEMQYFDTP